MKRLINFFTRLCESFLPDAFVFCLILTLIVFVAGIVATPHSPLQLVEFWGKDFWSLNAFAMQMVFVLISGHMLASTPLIQSGLRLLTSKVNSQSQALVLLSVFSLLACWINWGLGLIISAVLAVELAQKLGKVNFGLFIATGYSGFMAWHGGLSGSIPLKIAGKDEILSKVYPEMIIPLSTTIFAPKNLLILGLLMLVLPLLALGMRDGKTKEVGAAPAKTQESFIPQNFRDKLEVNKSFNVIFFLFFMIILYQAFQSGGGLDINRVNMVFLSLALLLNQTPRRFLISLQSSFGFASGIVIQYPFYAGLMGLMQYSGLSDAISSVFVGISTPKTLPLWTFFSGGLVNFFVPSGGGQWVVQGPIMLKAAQELGVAPAKIAMALAWGDAWTNMIQPFWALPLLALARVQLKDIMGYCLIYTAVTGAIISMVLLF